VRVGDTITISYEIVSANLDEAKTFAAITATNQAGEVVAVATHIMKFL
jgi:hypothetical protein